MNGRVHRAVSDIQGTTGMAIIRAILEGERDPLKLAKMRDPGCRHREQEMAEPLSGHWREDHLFSLQQSAKMYEAISERMAAYDQEMVERLGAMERADCQRKPVPELQNKNKAKMIRPRGEEPLRQAF
jgi:hypothetical protein